MCIFSGSPDGRKFHSVEQVSGTSIFARVSNGRQILVYSMNLRSRIDLAMILPLPVPPRSPENSVRFNNLKEYPQFFSDMEAGFDDPDDFSLSEDSGSGNLTRTMLRVHDVGNFEASYVPTMDDWDRLDKQLSHSHQHLRRTACLPGVRLRRVQA